MYRDYREPEQDLEPAPPMEDTSYLEPGQEASGEWPTDEERAAIKEQMQNDIDNDPRPPTAKEFIVDL